MSLYRIKQFYWSITSKIDSNDMKIIDEYLNKEEKTFFYKLSTYEQKHSVNVARDMIDVCKKNNIKENYLIKAALLHDIGKINKKINPIVKSILVVLDNISKGKIKKYDRIKVVDVYYNHGYKGYKLLKDTGNYDERFLYLIKNHHNHNIKGNEKLDLLKSCDSRN